MGSHHWPQTHPGEHKLTLSGHADVVNSVDFSPDGRTIASGCRDGNVYLWDAITGAPKRPDTRRGGGATLGDRLRTAFSGASKQALLGHSGSVESVAFSPDGATIASGSSDGTVHLWGSGTSDYKRLFIGYSGGVNIVAFSPDGRTIAVGSEDNAIRLRDALTGIHKQILTGHTGKVTSLAFSPDRRTLASGSLDGTIRWWDVDTGQQQTLKEHSDEVNSIAYSPDGFTLASGSHDGTILLWDVSGE